LTSRGRFTNCPPTENQRSLEEVESLPAANVLAGQIVENLQAALEQFESVYEALEEG
jgi:hypothetical protein